MEGLAALGEDEEAQPVAFRYEAPIMLQAQCQLSAMAALAIAAGRAL